ncbi:CHAT domain-containing protein, partial [Planctomycetota bacterium]
APAGMAFQQLAMTGPEIRAVSEHFEKEAAEPAIKLDGPYATEGNLRRLAGGRRVVHLATHGFARHDLASGITPLGVAGFDRLRPGHERFLVHYDLLVLTGLALAGANRREGSGDDDGILTALEAQDLNLEGCELVVLSACDTALGDMSTAGEGVIGLVRAFKSAGARSVVASLWPVDDEATRRLMEKLYAGAFRKGARRPPAIALRMAAAALRDTELEVIDARASMLRGREVRVKRRPFASPRHWAAFVAYGPLR